MHEGMHEYIWENAFPTIYDIKAYCAWSQGSEFWFWLGLLWTVSSMWTSSSTSELIFLIFKTYFAGLYQSSNIIRLFQGVQSFVCTKKEFNSSLPPTSPVYSQSKVYVNLISGKLGSIWNRLFFNCHWNKFPIR